MKRIMFGNFRLGFEMQDKKAHCEILDTKSQSKFTLDIDENGVGYLHNAGAEVSSAETFTKALKHLYGMYDKEVA